MASEVTQSTSDIFSIAKQALALMARHGVQPTPNNYAVWYHHAAGTDKKLSAELTKLVEEKTSFTRSVNDQLYETYIVPIDKTQVQETTEDAHKLLANILSSIAQFGGRTVTYNKEMKEHMAELDTDASQADLKIMAERIVQSATSLSQSSHELTEKLEASRREIHQLKENLAEVTQESERDFLTGVFNRKAFEDKLANAISSAKEDVTPLCLLMIDIDHFKAFNDQFGHQIGDEVLKIVAKNLTDSVKGKDTVARYGGEEFSVILPDTQINGAMIVADMIRKAIASKELKRRDTGENYGVITVSIGVGKFRPDSDDADKLIERADKALYRSKYSGRNRVTQEEPV